MKRLNIVSVAGAAFLLLSCLFLTRSPADIIVQDSFDVGDLVVDIGGPSAETVTVPPLAIGIVRGLRLSTRIASAGAVMSSVVDTESGTLSLDIQGLSTSTAMTPLHLDLSYRPQTGTDPLPTYSLAGYSGLGFDFTDVQGNGALIVELGSQSASYGPQAHRIPIITPGEVLVPNELMNFGTGGSIDSFNSMHVRFEAVTEQFSFTLNEIRLVPEPSTFVLMLVGALGMLARRRWQAL